MIRWQSPPRRRRYVVGIILEGLLVAVALFMVVVLASGVPV